MVGFTAFFDGLLWDIEILVEKGEDKGCWVVLVVLRRVWWFEWLVFG